MDEQQKAKLDQMNKLRRGAAIIEGTQDKFRQDGYTNLLNKLHASMIISSEKP